MALHDGEHEDAFALPTQVGRYRILAPLGSGGMATVLLARAEGIGGFERDVALKLIHPHLMKERDLVRQFLTEARVAARIRHPNVVPVLDVGEHSQGVHLVMEYVQGDSLTGLRRQARRQGDELPAAVWMRVFTDSLLGLHAAHELRDDDEQPLGVVHRDFTPHNILVGTDGVSRLCDFGVVKVASSSERTATGIVKGKLRYLAPEQARGRKLDRRCDVWAAGVTVWELLTGRPLHPQGDPVELLLHIAIDTPPRVRSVVAEVSAALDDAVAAALTVEIDLRCPSAAAFRERLIDAWGGQAKLASLDEVAAWVQRLCADKLGRLERKVERFQQLREELGSLVDPSEEDTTTSLVPAPGAALAAGGEGHGAPPGGVLTPVDASATTVEMSNRGGEGTGHTLSSASLSRPWGDPRRPRARRLLIAVAAATAVIAGAVAVWRSSGDAPAERARVVWGDIPVPPLPGIAPTASSAAAAPFAMRLDLDAPIVALRVGGRAVPLEGPTRRVALQLDEPAGSSVTVEARSVDGRRLRQQVVVRAGVVELSFPRISRARPRRTAPESPYE